MDHVCEFLQEMSLTFYAGSFEEMDYNDLDYLLSMGPKELLQLQELIKMMAFLMRIPCPKLKESASRR